MNENSLFVQALKEAFDKEHSDDMSAITSNSEHKFRDEELKMLSKAHHDVQNAINKSLGDFAPYKQLSNVFFQLDDVVIEYNQKYFLTDDTLIAETPQKIFNDFFEKVIELLEENLGNDVSYNKLDSLISDIYRISETIQDELDIVKG
nr:hypothetical protein [uncultured Ruminococcus sp.]